MLDDGPGGSSAVLKGGSVPALGPGNVAAVGTEVVKDSAVNRDTEQVEGGSGVSPDAATSTASGNKHGAVALLGAA